MKCPRPLFALLLAALAFPVSLPAQSGNLQVRVLDAAAHAPVAGAQVRLRGIGVGGVTDASGVLRLTGLAPGPRTVDVRMLGYGPQAVATQVLGGETVDLGFELQRTPIALEPVNVTARPGVLVQRGFFRRKEAGIGTFLTRAEIQELRPRTLSDVLRRQPGFLMTPTLTGASASSRGSSRTCPIQYYLDGVQTYALDIDDIPPGDVEGLEIYRGAASIPPAFNQGTAICGVILVWTRIE